MQAEVAASTASSKVYAKGKRVILGNAITTHHGDSANHPAGSQIAPSPSSVLASS